MTMTATERDMTAITRIDIEPAIATGRITVHSDFRLKDRVKAVPGARWDLDNRVWTVPLTWPSCLALRAELGGDLVIGDNLTAWAHLERAKKVRLAELRFMLTDVTLPLHTTPGHADLFPYQVTGSAAIELSRKYLLLDQTGTGKTRTALAGLSRIADVSGSTDSIFPLLIVAPKTMLPTWVRETEAFFPAADIRLCAGTPTKVRKALEPGGDVYVMGYSSLRTYSRLSGFGSVKLTEEQAKAKELNELEFTSVIADEVHRAKNPKSQQTRALWAAAKNATNRIGLTGTPIQDTPEDLWAFLHFANPEEYPQKTAFVDRFLSVSWNKWGGRDIDGLNPRHYDEFFANFETVSRRVTKDAALPFLPDKLYETRWVTLPAAQRRAYNSMRDDLIAELETTTMTAKSILERAGRLVQLANASGDVDADGVFTMSMPSPKIDAFLDDVTGGERAGGAKGGDFEGSSVVVFSDSRQLIDLLSVEMAKLKINHVTVTGSVTGDDRQDAIDRFQNGEVQFILLTRAGGEGITLTRADTMVRLVRSWSLTVHQQAEDRVHRIGSEIHSNVTYIDYVTEDTVETHQLVRLNAKAGRADEVLRDGELLSMLK